jgi:RNA polymerase sigma-70 factor (ECF subfamily)
VVITRNHAVAEDLTQEVFIVALRKGMEPGPATRLWLREVARRLAMNELRRKRHEALPEFDLAQPDPTAGVPTFETEVVALRQCLEQLPANDRHILNQRYEGNVPLAELSSEVGQSVGYLKQRFFRLRRALAQCIKRRLAQRANLHVQPAT